MANILSELLDGELGSFNDNEIADIITFSEAEWGLGLTLRPMQLVVLKALYNLPFDGTKKTIELREYPKDEIVDVLTEVEMLRRLNEQGRTNINPDIPEALSTPRQTLCLVAGRRSFKTFLASIISAYEIYKLILKGNPQPYFKLAPNEEIKISNVANNKTQANILFRALKARMLTSAFFSPYIASALETGVKIKTPYDIQSNFMPSIKVEALPCSARSLRGSGMITLVTDEFAHFKDNDGQQSDSQIFKALSPSTKTFISPEGLPEGKVIAISSPLGEQGVMFDLAERAVEGNFSICYFRLPTWEANPTIPMQVLRNEEEQMGTQDFKNEYGADWLGGSQSFFDIPEKLKASYKEGGSVDPKLHWLSSGARGQAYYLGIDAGNQSDGFAIALVHFDPPNVVLDHAVVFYAGEPPFESHIILPPGEIADYIAGLFKHFNIHKGVMDQWESFGLYQLLLDRGIDRVERQVFDRGINSRIYKAFRQRVYFNNFRMPDDPELIRSLLRLRQQKFSGNQIKVEAPIGGHDDIADAIARAVWVCEEECLTATTPVTVSVRGAITHRSSVFTNVGSNRQQKSFQKQVARARLKGAYLYKNLMERK